MTSTASPWNDAARAPSTRRTPAERRLHGDVFTDDYEWLRAKEDPEVLAQLEAENRYAEAVTEPLGSLREAIFGEIKARTRETDLSVPVRKGDWWYFRRTAEGSDYPVFCRVPAETTGETERDWTPPEVPTGERLADEQVLLDANALAEGLPFFSLGAFQVTRDGRHLTYSVDDSGDERYTQYVRDLERDELLPDRLEGVFGGGFLTPDAGHLVYTLVDDSWRPYEVRAHRLGASGEDRVLAREEDPTLWLGAGLSSDESHLVLDAGCSEYNEARLLPLTALDDDAAEPWTVIGREDRVLYDAEPVTLPSGPHLLVTHDHAAPNGQLLLVGLEEARAAGSVGDLERAGAVLLGPSETRRLNGVGLTGTHLVLDLREDTLPKAAFLPLGALEGALRGEPLPDAVEPGFEEELYSAGVGAFSVHSPVVGLAYSSFVTPGRRYDYFPETGALRLRKETPVLGGYDPARYTARREWARAEDGTRIPVSVLHRADLDLTREHPVVQYGYGSYEISMDPGFSISRLSLLDRGVVYAVAHVRGGGELGRRWYTDGKKLRKLNTFTDFIAVTDHLAAQPWADAGRIAATGGSAGGLLMGGIANMAPERYCGILAVVPFVDPVTSVSDPELPLSALEWEEWGNPLEDPEAYAYMMRYSPYENVGALRYPPIAAVTSLNDTRVLYVEPAKWVPRLRALGASDAPVLLRTEMEGGHGGGSGRYTRWRDTAWEYAFLLACLGAAG
ncbi:S9 family peptidase [Rothia sp. AR01]|uniref:S9 family peptidase n=1 Tax=Rothia santali TaxID=2949643 RepID=A0A9X2HE04_9MICC|nr:S9 family peptidase [Rothia santali]MCP3425102.1 S9 family peptidase [Rothia santali]